MPKQRDLFILAGTGLFDPRHLGSPETCTVLMVEDQMLCRRTRYHKQKLAFILAAMRDHRDLLTSCGFEVDYFDLNTGVGLPEAMTTAADRRKPRSVHYFETDESAPTKAIEAAASKLGLATQPKDSPMFLTSTARLDGFFSGSNPAMSTFAQQQYEALGLQTAEFPGTLQNNAICDIDRRKFLPRPHCVVHTANASEVIDMVDTRFPRYPGRSEGLWLPTTRQGALDWLERFLQQRLAGFTSYDESITQRSRTVHHSVLSPLLNVGLITPDEVVEQTLTFARRNQVTRTDVAGFLDQIVVQREFIRGAYRVYGTSMRRRNAWSASRKLGKSWLKAETGIPPLDHALQGAIDWSWNHHTERLMVIANLMKLAEIAPNDVYRFFMSHYIDAYDWVMVPNVYGVGLQSEGSIFATRQNLCRSGDLLRVSDFGPGPWCDVVDGLYWRFVLKHQDLLTKDPSMRELVCEARALPTARRDEMLRAGEAFLTAHTR